jgi:ABC-type bacteriocin/lantibiotic exporter with double-glycine peptidase domain
MPSKLPFFRQESDKSRALACLRMLLAGRGINVTEAELAARTTVQVEGVAFEDVERLARQHRLSATIERLTLVQVAALLERAVGRSSLWIGV